MCDLAHGGSAVGGLTFSLLI